MKKTILRGVAFTMAVLLFATSVGFCVDFHYCKGELKSFSFIGKAQSCHANAAKPCPVHQKMMIMEGEQKFDCCNNETVFIQSDQDIQFHPTVIANDIQFEDILPSTFDYFSFFEKIALGKEIHPPPNPDPPPLIKEDLQIWNQIFRC